MTNTERKALSGPLSIYIDILDAKDPERKDIKRDGNFVGCLRGPIGRLCNKGMGESIKTFLAAQGPSPKSSFRLEGGGGRGLHEGLRAAGFQPRHLASS